MEKGTYAVKVDVSTAATSLLLLSQQSGNTRFAHDQRWEGAIFAGKGDLAKDSRTGNQSRKK